MVLYIRTDKRRKDTLLVLQDGSDQKLHINGLKLLDHFCYAHGSSLEGRRQAIMKTLGIMQKVPILIDEATREMYFPLFDLRRTINYWINERYIESVAPCTKKTCWIRFLAGIFISGRCSSREAAKKTLCALFGEIRAEAGVL